MSDENIIENLKNSVQSIIAKTGADSKYSKDLLNKIQSLQEKLNSLSSIEKNEFVKEMKDSFHDTIKRVQKKVVQHAQFEKVYNYSIVAAVIFIILLIAGWSLVFFYEFNNSDCF